MINLELTAVESIMIINTLRVAAREEYDRYEHCRDIDHPDAQSFFNEAIRLESLGRRIEAMI